MSKKQPEVQYPDLEGSKQHHDLKNQPGESADPDHAAANADPTKKLKTQVKASDEDGQIADELRNALKSS